jgi:AcrR family transcriptional regulator
MCAVTLRDPEIRRKILDVTRQLIIEKGVHNTSLADVARKAGISKGTLFYYYATKSELIFEVTDQHFKQTTRRLSEWADQVSGEVQASEILDHVFHSIVDDELRGKLHHYLIEEAIIENGSLKERFTEKYREWTALMVAGLSRVLNSDENQELLANIITTCLDGLVIQTILGVKDIPIEAMAAYFSEIVSLKPASKNPHSQIPESERGELNEC